MKLRVYLLVLVLVAVVPLLAFSAVMFWHNFDLQRDAIERGQRETARALSLAVDCEIGIVRGILETLAASQYLDPGTCGPSMHFARIH